MVIFCLVKLEFTNRLSVTAVTFVEQTLMHSYQSVSQSVGRSIGRSVGRLVGRSVGRWVGGSVGRYIAAKPSPHLST